MKSTDIIKQLTEALQAASDHLDYCGYGDSYERECALEAKLPEQIAEALKASEDFTTEVARVES